jgi:chemotaxis family two-component system response regulator Rcp1
LKEHLARSAESLRRAVRYLANSSCAPKEKLMGVYDTEFGSIWHDDFPGGSLKDDYLTIISSIVNPDEPKAAANIAAMSDEQARTVIQQICSLSQATAYALGRQSNSER